MQLAESILVFVKKIILWIEFWEANNGCSEFRDGIIWKWPKVPDSGDGNPRLSRPTFQDCILAVTFIQSRYTIQTRR